MLGRALFRRLVFVQNLPRAHDHIVRQTCEFRDLDAITLIRRSRLDFTQKHNVSARFLNTHVKILDVGQERFEFGEFVVVRGEKCFGFSARVDLFDYGPGYGETIVGCGAASDLIEKYQ